MTYQNNMPTRVKLTDADPLDEQSRTPGENECICVDLDREQKFIIIIIIIIIILLLVVIYFMLTNK